MRPARPKQEVRRVRCGVLRDRSEFTRDPDCCREREYKRRRYEKIEVAFTCAGYGPLRLAVAAGWKPTASKIARPASFPKK